MLIASKTPNHTLLCAVILFAAFIVMNLLLFRSSIFKKRSLRAETESDADSVKTESSELAETEKSEDTAV